MTENLLLLAGGIGLYILGMQMMTDALRQLASRQLREALRRFTTSPLSGAVTGAAATAVVQSSSAVLVTTMREAWALRDARSDIGHQRSAISEKTSEKPAAPQSLADRLRAGSKALDHDRIAARLAAIQLGREMEKEHVSQEAERLRAKELEQECEAEVRREREGGA